MTERNNEECMEETIVGQSTKLTEMCSSEKLNISLEGREKYYTEKSVEKAEMAEKRQETQDISPEDLLKLQKRIEDVCKTVATKCTVDTLSPTRMASSHISQLLKDVETMRQACEKILVFQEKKNTGDLQIEGEECAPEEKHEWRKEEGSMHSSETTDVLQEEATTDSVEKIIENNESFDSKKEVHKCFHGIKEIGETTSSSGFLDDRRPLRDLSVYTKVSRISEVLDSLSDSLETKNNYEPSEHDSEEDHVVCQWSIQSTKFKPLKESINETNTTLGIKNYYAPSNQKSKLVQENEEYNEKDIREPTNDMSQGHYRNQKCLDMIPQAIIVLDNEKTLTYDIMGNGTNSMESKNTFVSVKKEQEAAHAPFIETIPFNSQIIAPSQCMYYAETYEKTQKNKVEIYEPHNEINECCSAPNMTIPQGYAGTSSVVSETNRYPSYKAQEEHECDTTQMIRNETVQYANVYNPNFLCNGKGLLNEMSSPTNELDGVGNGVKGYPTVFVKTTPCQHYDGHLSTWSQSNKPTYTSVASLPYQEYPESSPYRQRQMNPLERSYNTPPVYVQNAWKGRSEPLEASPDTFYNNALDPSALYEQSQNGIPKHVLEAKYYTHMYACQNNKERLGHTLGDNMQNRTSNVVLVNGYPNGNPAENQHNTAVNETRNQHYGTNDLEAIENMRKLQVNAFKYEPNQFPTRPNYEFLAQHGLPKEPGFLRRRVQQRHAKDTTTPKAGFWGSRFDYIKRTFALC